MNTKALREWIEKNNPAGITKLAAACEINTATINRILKGEPTTTTTLHKLAKATGIAVGDLLSDEPKSKKRAG